MDGDLLDLVNAISYGQLVAVLAIILIPLFLILALFPWGKLFGKRKPSMPPMDEHQTMHFGGHPAHNVHEFREKE